MRLKSIIFTAFLALLLVHSGCLMHQTVIPKMDLPREPVKPKIQSQVITQGDKAFVAYTIPDALRLYEFLLEEKAYQEKLIYRIDTMNGLLQGK